MTHAGTITILFTDLVDSTDLIARRGDEQARLILQAHRSALIAAARANEGREVKWTGDGLMVCFNSSASAVRAAIAMQRAAQVPIEDERLSIRIGLNVGEALEDESDYVGGSVVIARRVCDTARGGQILCTDLVTGLLRGRRSFSFTKVGDLPLKGIPDPVAVFELNYELGRKPLAARTPFIGRNKELAAILNLGESARRGEGSVAVVSGDPGIGKTRFAQEISDSFTSSGGTALWGASREGGWGPPLEPIVNLLDAYLGSASRQDMDTELRPFAGVLSQISNAVREAFPSVSAPEAVQPDEERYRITTSVTSFLTALAARTPVLVVLDDLHWADSATVEVLRRLVPATRTSRILLLLLHRASELAPDGPFARYVHEVPRDAEATILRLDGLVWEGVGRLASALVEDDVNQDLVSVITRQTGGNPFFVRELLLSMVEDGAIAQEADGTWSTTADLHAVRVPETVRQVLTKRLSRTSVEASQFLRTAAAFDGPFPFAVAAQAAGLDEEDALDALDEALDARMLTPADTDELYAFTHSLLSQALYAELSPSRRTRIHRAIADGMRASGPALTFALHAQVAQHYHRSRDLAGADEGIPHARAVAEHALSIGSFAEAITYFGIALALAQEDSDVVPRLHAGLAIALAWAMRWDDAARIARQAADGIAATEGRAAAADFLALAVATIATSGSEAHSWSLVPRGLELVGDRRDLTWAVFMAEELFSRNATPTSLGIEVDSPERRELNSVLLDYLDRYPEQLEDMRSMAFLPLPCFESRAEVLAYIEQNRHVGELPLLFAGELRSTLTVERKLAQAHLERGHLASAVVSTVNVARAHTALGNFSDARRALSDAWDLAAHVPRGGYLFIQVVNAQEELTAATDDGWTEFGDLAGVPLASDDPIGLVQQVFGASSERQFLATIQAVAARAFARIGRPDIANELVAAIVPAIRVAPPWAINLPKTLCTAAEALWITGDIRSAALLEAAVREKLIAPDFRYPGVDGRLAMGQLRGLRGDIDDAVTWFLRARDTLTEMGARPMLAVVDLCEGQLHLRAGDPDGAKPLLHVARHRFMELEMTGWTRRVNGLLERMTAHDGS